jgi:hypothetical protein
MHLCDFKQEYQLSYEQTRVVNDIMNCRTSNLGGVLRVCDQCGHWEFKYKSCKNRHCPKCGSFEKAQWLEGQKVWLLPIPYFHVVFTIDHIFNPSAWLNQVLFYNLLIQTAANLLKAYGRKYLGGEIGFTMVLHTWGQTMQPHIHCHFILTGGALVCETNGYRWQPAKPDFLFPVKLLSKDFRDAFCSGVRKLSLNKKLKLRSEDPSIDTTIQSALSKNWEVFIQPPMRGPDRLLDYLGRYIHRIAISNHRIIDVSKGQVSFQYLDNRSGGARKTRTVSAVDFIGSFLMHVLPNRFTRVRHFGLHHPSCRPKLIQTRKLLGLSDSLPVFLKLTLIDWLKSFLGPDEDPNRCPRCHIGVMLPIRDFGPMPSWQPKLLSFFSLFFPWKLFFPT